jgi:hypothetical protein
LLLETSEWPIWSSGWIAVSPQCNSIAQLGLKMRQEFPLFGMECAVFGMAYPVDYVECVWPATWNGPAVRCQAWAWAALDPCACGKNIGRIVTHGIELLFAIQQILDQWVGLSR